LPRLRHISSFSIRPSDCGRYLLTRARQEKFQSILRKAVVVATLRREKGHDIAAACGQLPLQTNRAGREPQLSA
jgi:adenine C2-methylase RlmN of 23S rRNA A2503 and tRNA A37